MTAFGRMMAVRNSPIDSWGQRVQEKEIVEGRFFGRSSIMLNSPDAIRHVTAEGVVHSTQMIHQYTMCRTSAGKPPRHCALLMMMIPFFYERSGRRGFPREAGARVRAAGPDKGCTLLADGVAINVQQLSTEHVDRMLQYMVQVCVRMKTAPFCEFIESGETFYDLTGAPSECWQNGFDAVPRGWVMSARQGALK